MSLKKMGLFLPLTGRIIPKKFIGFDIETYGEKNIFRLGSFVFDKSVKTFFDRDKMINYIFNNKRIFQGKYIVATNLQFDLMGLFFGHEKFSKLNILWNDSRIISASIKCEDRNKHGDITFIDTMNFNPVALKILGKIIGIPKLDMDKELFKKKHLSDDELKEMIIYNINDAKISQQYMYHLQKTLNDLGGNIKLTLPSSAMDLFRRQFMDIYLQKERKVLDDNTIEEFILKGFYGGRTEDFYRGVKVNVNYYDVNSEHPFSMTKNFPIPQSVEKVINPSINNIINYMGMSECDVFIENMNIPLLPYRKNEKIIYPIGNFRGVWSHEMLKEAINLGYVIKKIHKQIIYKQEYPFFKKYIDTLYSKRLEYKAVQSSEEQTIKLAMNGLYGKFGERPHNVYNVMLEKDMDSQKMLKLLKNGSDIQLSNDKQFFIITKKSNRYPRNCFPILTAYVTSYSNILLHRLLRKYKPLYCDTDSIMTVEKLPNELIGNELGKLKLEDIGIVEIVAPKFYKFNDNIKVKGLRLPKKKYKDGVIINNEERTKIFNDYKNGLKIRQEQFVKFKTAIRTTKGYTPNQVITIEKKRLTSSDKRIYDKTGHSLPICINEVYNEQDTI